MSGSLQVWAADKELKHTDCKMDQKSQQSDLLNRTSDWLIKWQSHMRSIYLSEKIRPYVAQDRD